MSNPGFFLCLEGIDGSGKGTIASLIIDFFQKSGIDIVHTREPGGTPAAEKIREMVLWGTEDCSDDFSNWGEACLYMASRNTHIENFIKPNLAEGKIVLCERFCDSTYAHQGGGRGLSIDKLKQLHTLVNDDFQPDLTIVLDGDPKVFAKRMADQGRNPDRLEKAGLEFQVRSREIHLTEANNPDKNYLVVDATQPIDQVFAQIVSTLMAIINRLRQRPDYNRM